MFKNTYQSGFLSILYSIGSKPLQIWDKQSTILPIQFITDTSSASLTKTFSLLYSKSWAPMSLPPSSLAPKMKQKLSESNCLFWSWSSRMYASFDSVKKILHIRSASTRRQERKKKVQSIKLSVYNKSKTIYLHYAHEIGLRLESDSVQFIRFHKKGLW